MFGFQSKKKNIVFRTLKKEHVFSNNKIKKKKYNEKDMHKNLLIIVFFCFLQILYSIQNCWEISSEQYCFDGTNSFSDNKYFQVPKEVILQELNQWLIQENEGATKFEIISKNDDENIPRMTKREIVKKEETITKFKLHQTINSDLFEQEIYVHSTNIIQNYKKIQGFEWLSSEAKITLALLHHFYNIESSPFKVWLRALPLKTFPLFSNLSEEAINIVSHEQLAIREIKRIKEKIVDDYKGLTTAIDKLPSEIKVQLLNNRSNITFNDWVVAYFIILKQSWMLFNVRYLVPGANFAEYAINPKIEQEPMAYQSLFSESHIVTHDKSVYFLAENDILHFQNITDNFGKLQNFFAIFLYNTKINNQLDCLEVELIDETGFFKFSEEKRKVLSGAGIGNRL